MTSQIARLMPPLKADSKNGQLGDDTEHCGCTIQPQIYGIQGGGGHKRFDKIRVSTLHRFDLKTSRCSAITSKRMDPTGGAPYGMP